MATHRRATDTQPPTYLTDFDAEDWRGGQDWPERFRVWQRARRAWATQNPGSVLGDQVDQLQAELMACRDALTRWPSNG